MEGLRAWTKNIQSKVIKEKQQELNATLHALLQETDKNSFNTIFETITHSFTHDEDLNEFGNYF